MKKREMMKNRLLWTLYLTLVTTLAWPDRHKADNYTSISLRQPRLLRSTFENMRSSIKNPCYVHGHRLSKYLFTFIWRYLNFSQLFSNSINLSNFPEPCLNFSHLFTVFSLTFTVFPLLLYIRENVLESFLLEIGLVLTCLHIVLFPFALSFLPRDLLLGVIGRCHTLNTSKKFKSFFLIPYSIFLR